MARYAATAAALLLLVATLAPQHALGQAVAFAGSGNPFVAAGAGFPATPAPPPPPCVTSASRVPWGVPALIFGQPVGLLTPDNRTYSDVTLCCGGVIDFSWTRPHGIFQLPSRTCPKTFSNGPSGQELRAISPNATASLSFNVPGTYYITSQFGTDCDQGMLFAVNVPADPANAQCIVPAGGPTAFASGPPGGTSTSTSENAAAAASGPPGTTNTFTSDGFSFSSAGR